MAKFNIARLRGLVAPRTATATSPIRGEQLPSARTHEGAPGYRRTVQGELFLLAGIEPAAGRANH